MCIHPKRSHPKHRHCLIRNRLFHGCLMDENTSTITFEAKPGLIRTKNSLPMITCPVDMLTCSLQTFPHDVSGTQMAGRLA
ncbi:hypothetical protein TNCV_1125271 [Trichonephila clavipes]|nr:hypothetical protein TNCV_1125271 [Trichonephila clavipes]